MRDQRPTFDPRESTEPAEATRSAGRRLRLWAAGFLILAGVLGLVAYAMPQFGRTMDEMYGEDGFLDRRDRYGVELVEGEKALLDGRFEDAERYYRGAVKDAFRENRAISHDCDRVGSDVPALEGLATALARQGRFGEAAAAFDRAVAAAAAEWGPADPRVGETSGHRDAVLKTPADDRAGSGKTPPGV